LEDAKDSLVTATPEQVGQLQGKARAYMDLIKDITRSSLEEIMNKDKANG
jgi:hypothetical protein